MLKYLFKVEYSSEKFCSFFVNLKEQFDYSFVKLTADIRSNIRSLQYLTPTTIRIRFRDEEGDFDNLPFDNCELFISPLERYASKLESDVKTQSQKIALLRENINDIDERLSQAKSAQIAGNLTVCGTAT